VQLNHVYRQFKTDDSDKYKSITCLENKSKVKRLYEAIRVENDDYN
jgi:hypothetical protein